MAKLAWSSNEYVKITAQDLLQQPPTAEQRIRIAAALATKMRDCAMTGHTTQINAELIRAVLVMDDAAWARDVKPELGLFIEGYDPVDPKVRFEQTALFHDAPPERRRN